MDPRGINAVRAAFLDEGFACGVLGPCPAMPSGSVSACGACRKSSSGNPAASIHRADRLSVEHRTCRESGVLAFVARGLSNKEIAYELKVSVATVKNHLTTSPSRNCACAGGSKRRSVSVGNPGCFVPPEPRTSNCRPGVSLGIPGDGRDGRLGVPGAARVSAGHNPGQGRTGTRKAPCVGDAEPAILVQG